MTDSPAPSIDYPAELARILREFDCQTGTLHQSTPDGEFLELICQIGVPDSLLDKITLIPFGKGIAGVAAARREPVELCNLQQDLGGVAKPDARKTGVSGSLAVPIFEEDGERVLGTLGIGKAIPHDFTAGEKSHLEAEAAALARHLVG
jgi:L-methionine (R)-S-oxide reductase